LKKIVSAEEKKSEEADPTETYNPPKGHKDSSDRGLSFSAALDVHHFISKNW